LSAKPLFVYGTLRDPDIMDALLGRPVRSQQASAPGFRSVHHPHRTYPALIPSADGKAPGLLLRLLTPAELAILDTFEGDEYRRATIAVSTPAGLVDADVYLPIAAIPPDAAPWTLEQWTQEHKAAMLDEERRVIAARRGP
jgi:gamma-glutamylcyclotransferase (GGCT)/AIG2-like uncharacterized protein YtfP